MRKERVGDIGEFKLIEKLNHDFIRQPGRVVLGSGDDGAVYKARSGCDQVISVDTMVEGVHFLSSTMGPEDVGYKLAASTISDMAAMGAVPENLMISCALPKDLPEEWICRCYDGIRLCCQAVNVNILGGDTARSPSGIVLTGVVTGTVPFGKAVSRGGAKPGDLVFVTGTVGDSGAGLDVIRSKKENDFPKLAKKHRRPLPRVSWGEQLREIGAHSLNDISDGLSSELFEIAKASGVDMVIDEMAIPLSRELCRWAKTKEGAWSYALSGGEDYELAGTMALASFAALPSDMPITAIGRVTGKGEGSVYIINGDQKRKLLPGGYDHFS